MDTDDALLFPGTDQLHGRPHTLWGEGIAHWRELGLVNPNLSVSLSCLGFAQTDGGHRRVGEHHAGDIVVVDPTLRLIVEQPVGQTTPRGNGYRGQRRATGNVANGVDTGHIGVLILVRRHNPVTEGLNPRCREIQRLGIGLTAYGPDDSIETVQSFSVSRVQGDTGLGLRQTGHLKSEPLFNALLFHLPHQHLADHGIKELQQPLFQGHQGHLRTQGFQ